MGRSGWWGDGGKVRWGGREGVLGWGGMEGRERVIGGEGTVLHD